MPRRARVLELVRPLPDGRVASPSEADATDADGWLAEGNGAEPGVDRPKGADPWGTPRDGTGGAGGAMPHVSQ